MSRPALSRRSFGAAEIVARDLACGSNSSGRTQEALAEKVGVSRVHLANVESDESAAHHRTPSLALLDKLAKAFKVSVADLLK